MSADNWRECPRCWVRHTEAVHDKASEAAAKASRAYGVAAPEEYLELKAEADRLAKEMENPEIDRTLREDYEIYSGDEGGDGLTVDMSYRCSCRECGLARSIKYSEELPLEDPEP